MCEDNFIVDELNMLFVSQNENTARLRNMYIPDYQKNKPVLHKHDLLMQTLNNLTVFAGCVYNVQVR